MAFGGSFRGGPQQGQGSSAAEKKQKVAPGKSTRTSKIRPAQAKRGGGAGAGASAGSEAAAAPPGGGGRPLPGALQAKMGRAFGTDFSAVRVHEGSQASAIGALAYTQGSDIHFAPGQYDPGSQGGQELIGHELTHVVQQQQGRVAATAQAKGVAINDDSALEREADEMGARAARMDAGAGSGAVSEIRPGVAGPVQRREDPAAPTPAGTSTPAAPAADIRGGNAHLIRAGDTLWKIAETTYDHGRYWRRIMEANPSKVGRGGDLILVGDTLQLPAIDVASGRVETPATPPRPEQPAGAAGGDAPTPEGPSEGPAEAPPPPRPEQAAGGAGGAGGADTPEPEAVCEAVEPRELSNDYGSFSVYPDDYRGPLPPAGVTREPDIEYLRESEFERVVAEREAAAEEERDRTIGDVEELLSYGAFDWAITDAEARQALNLLGGLPMTQLRVAVGRIDSDRLLDNLPEDARRTPAFAKVIVAAGAEHYREHITALLSYGAFDWAVTDGDVRSINDILEAVGEAEQITFLRGLEPDMLSRYARNISRGTGSNELLKTVFDIVPDSDLDAMQTVMEARFNIDLRSWVVPRALLGVGEDWDAPGLRRLWTIFEELPPEHLENNEALDLFLREDQNDGSGFYNSGLDAGVISYSNTGETGSYGRIMVPDGHGGTKDVGLHSNVNLFSTVVRHEVGHAVDADIGASAPGGYVRSASNAGEWATYGSDGAFVDAIIAAGGGMSGHGYADEAKYERAMRDAVSDEVDFTTALNDIDGSVAAPNASVTGPVAAVFSKDRWHPDTSPWYNNGDRQDVGGRLWQRPYGSGDYASFVKSARVDHGVSAYQFRAPGEWFAEAYAAYYSDNDGAAGNPVGTRLRTRDTAAADWFDANVDNGHSLQQRAGGGGAGGGGAGGAGAGGGGAAGAG